MGGTGGSKWEALASSNAAVPCSSPSACQALAFHKGIECPWVPAGSQAMCRVTVSKLDIVVALQGKAVWELQQKKKKWKRLHIYSLLLNATVPGPWHTPSFPAHIPLPCS